MFDGAPTIGYINICHHMDQRADSGPSSGCLPCYVPPSNTELFSFQFLSVYLPSLPLIHYQNISLRLRHITIFSYGSFKVIKIGIQSFSRFLLVVHGQKSSKPHFHGSDGK